MGRDRFLFNENAIHRRMDIGEESLETFPGVKKPGHDRAEGAPDGVGDFLVGFVSAYQAEDV